MTDKASLCIPSKERAFYYLRHATIQKKLKHILLGRTFEKITLDSYQKIIFSCSILESLNIKKIFCSPTVRAIETSQIFSENLKCPYEIVDDLDEWHMTLSKLINYVCKKFLLKQLDKNYLESPNYFKRRIIKALNYCLKSEEGTFLIVSHGHFYKILKTILLKNKKFLFVQNKIKHIQIINFYYLIKENQWKIKDLIPS